MACDRKQTWVAGPYRRRPPTGPEVKVRIEQALSAARQKARLAKHARRRFTWSAIDGLTYATRRTATARSRSCLAPPLHSSASLLATGGVFASKRSVPPWDGSLQNGR